MFRALSVILWVSAAVYVAIVLPPLLSIDGFAYERFVRIGILALLALSLLELALRTWRVGREHKGVATFQELFAQAQRGDHKPGPYRPRDPRATRRVNHMVECSKAGISKLHEAVPAAASIDAAMLAGSYGPLNVYAWVLPVLGFMGTALGMAAAIGGFREALGKTRGDLNALVDVLGDKVVPGLADAFHVTILALGASLVVYLCTSALKDWDQDALNKLDRLCIVMLSSVPLPQGPEAEKMVLAIEQISAQLASVLRAPVHLEEASRAIAAASERLIAASRELEEAASAPYTVTIERGKRLPGKQPAADGGVRAL
jgi:biopolymer transport protein ExbB/TolQ